MTPGARTLPPYCANVIAFQFVFISRMLLAAILLRRH